MPIKVKDLEKEFIKSSVRGKILEFLKSNSELAFTLKEIHTFFIENDKKSNKAYIENPDVLYKLIYNYLRDFCIHGIVAHKGNYYYYKKGVK